MIISESFSVGEMTALTIQFFSLLTYQSREVLDVDARLADECAQQSAIEFAMQGDRNHEYIARLYKSHVAAMLTRSFPTVPLEGANRVESGANRESVRPGA
jgi:hypothetical protein